MSQALKVEKGTTKQDMDVVPMAGEVKEIDSHLELPDSNAACLHLDFSPVRPGLDS